MMCVVVWTVCLACVVGGYGLVNGWVYSIAIEVAIDKEQLYYIL